MCRAPVDYEVDSLAAAPPPLDLVQADNFKPSAELRCLQQQMAALFLRQKQRGGIIQQDSSVLLLTVSKCWVNSLLYKCWHLFVTNNWAK